MLQLVPEPLALFHQVNPIGKFAAIQFHFGFGTTSFRRKISLNIGAEK